MDSDYNKILKLKEMKFTYEDIGRLYNVTGQRIFQVVKDKDMMFPLKKKIKMGRTREERLQYYREKQRKYYIEHKEVVKATNRRSDLKNKEKVRARVKLNHLIRSGKMIKPDSCSVCSTTNSRIEGHHRNYNEPTKVIWLCTLCHNKEHKNML